MCQSARESTAPPRGAVSDERYARRYANTLQTIVIRDGIHSARARPPAIAMTSGRPSGLQLIRVYHGSIMGVLGGPRRRRDFMPEL